MCEARVPHPAKPLLRPAASAQLEAMLRRIYLTHVALWTATATPTSMRTGAAAAAPGGYAQVPFTARLAGNASDATSAPARLAQSLAPNVALPTRRQIRTRRPCR